MRKKSNWWSTRENRYGGGRGAELCSWGAVHHKDWAVQVFRREGTHSDDQQFFAWWTEPWICSDSVRSITAVGIRIHFQPGWNVIRARGRTSLGCKEGCRILVSNGHSDRRDFAKRSIFEAFAADSTSFHPISWCTRLAEDRISAPQCCLGLCIAFDVNDFVDEHDAYIPTSTCHSNLPSSWKRTTGWDIGTCQSNGGNLAESYLQWWNICVVFWIFSHMIIWFVFFEFGALMGPINP